MKKEQKQQVLAFMENLEKEYEIKMEQLEKLENSRVFDLKECEATKEKNKREIDIAMDKELPYTLKLEELHPLFEQSKAMYKVSECIAFINAYIHSKYQDILNNFSLHLQNYIYGHIDSINNERDMNDLLKVIQENSKYFSVFKSNYTYSKRVNVYIKGQNNIDNYMYVDFEKIYSNEIEEEDKERTFNWLLSSNEDLKVEFLNYEKLYNEMANAMLRNEYRKQEIQKALEQIETKYNELDTYHLARYVRENER